MLDTQGNDIDAVIVTVPDHMHSTAALACMERGKHVYVQKPMSQTVWEARVLTEAAKKYKVATQMGNQGYAQEGARHCVGDDLERRDRRRDRSARLDQPPDLAAGPHRDSARRTPAPATLDWDLWLGHAEAVRTRPAAAHDSPFGGPLLSAVQLARLLRFRMRSPGRYGVPRSGRR